MAAALSAKIVSRDRTVQGNTKVNIFYEERILCQKFGGSFLFLPSFLFSLKTVTKYGS
jgi:hypothetical protein